MKREAHRDSKKVFGIGWAKTGTTTLGRCFEILGYNHQSQDLELAEDIAHDNLSNIFARVNKKDTFEDWPWIILYKELDKAFPDSKFILTRRDPEKWIKSYQNLGSIKGRAPKKLTNIRRLLYGLPFPDVTKEQLLDRYLKHNKEVLEYFHDRPQSLLVVNFEEGDGWKEICDFLSKDIPLETFPHANRGKYDK